MFKNNFKNNSSFVMTSRKARHVKSVSQSVSQSVVVPNRPEWMRDRRKGKEDLSRHNASRQSDTTQRIASADISQLWPDKPQP